MADDCRLLLKPGQFTRRELVFMNQEQLERINYRGCPVIFTMTTGRSGTQWLAGVLQQSEVCRVVHEPSPKMFATAREVIEGTYRPHKRHMWDCVGPLVRHAYNRKQGLCHLSPFLTPLAPYLLEAFEHARFLHLVREPRAFVMSAEKRGWARFNSPWAHWWPRSRFEGFNEERPSQDPDWRKRDETWKRLAVWWGLTHRTALDFAEDHPEVVHTVRSEDLWGSDPESLSNLFTWLGAKPSDVVHLTTACNEAQERRVDPSGAAAWPEEREQFLLDVAGDVIERLS